jgi:seryl-tRNA synthetase
VPRARIDFKYIRDNASDIVRNCKQRKLPIKREQVDLIIEKYGELVAKKAELNDILAKRNVLSQSIKAATADERPALVEQAALLKPDIQALEQEVASIDAQAVQLASVLPNTTHAKTPVGNESRVKILGYINEENQYTAKGKVLDHVEISSALDLVDFDAAAKTSGHGFYYLKNEAVELEMALTQYALAKAKSAGFTLLRCPDLVRSEFVPACGFQPRDQAGQQVYEISSADGALSLVGTAEIPIAALAVDQIYTPGQLPMRYAAVGRAFRAEAGARGADTRGLYRVHEFTKIELFSFSTAEQSQAEFDAIIKIQKEIIKELGLCGRVLEMPTEELGASAHRKVDIECWMPTRNGWGEVTSTSNCTDYQARRLNARYKDQDGMRFLHTVNGTAIAVPRILVAGLENWYKHGVVRIPRCLRPFLGGIEDFGKPEKHGDGNASVHK